MVEQKETLDYFEADTTWTSFGIKTREQYVERFVFKGKFHTQVHEDVTKSFETAEFLMAHAWYHYRMYDEALKKLLSIFEMAIRLRCKELNIQTECITKKSQRQGRRLFELTKELADFGYPQKIFRAAEWLRELRNMFAHPDRHSFGGGVFAQNVIPIINFLNQVFLPVGYFNEQIATENKLNGLLEKFKNALFVLKENESGTLVFNPALECSIKVNSIWHHFVSFNHVIPDPQKFLEENWVITPVILNLRNIQFYQNGIQGISQESKGIVTILVTTVSWHNEVLENHKKVFDNLSPEQLIGFDLTSGTVYRELQEFMYWNCWEPKNSQT
jgi:hypothetical protein